MAQHDLLDPPADRPAPATDHAPTSARPGRVSLRQPVAVGGFIDGGWWPYSNDLVAELPALLDVFWTASRDVVHVSYNLDLWDAAPRRLTVEGRRVRLAGFRGQNPLTVFLSDSRHGDTAELLLIRFDTDPEIAQRALELASASGGVDRAAQMLENAGAAGRH